MQVQSNSTYLAVVTLLIVLSAFGIANLWTVFHIPACCDQIHSMGFPWSFFERGGFAGTVKFHTYLLIADIAIALAVSILCGWAVLRLGKAKSAA